VYKNKQKYKKIMGENVGTALGPHFAGWAGPFSIFNASWKICLVLQKWVCGLVRFFFNFKSYDKAFNV